MDPEPQKVNRKKLILTLITLLLVALGALLFLYFMNQDSPKSSVNTTKVATKSAPVATASSEQESTLSDAELIKKALVVKTGISAETINVAISQNVDGKYAKGTVGVLGEETGGGYFLATKINSEWVIVYDGQATPECSAVNPYNFPVSMVPECLDSAGSVVTRS
jgi:hypothetical protein